MIFRLSIVQPNHLCWTLLLIESFLVSDSICLFNRYKINELYCFKVIFVCSNAEFLHPICKCYVSRVFKGLLKVLSDLQSECSSKFDEFQVLRSHWLLLNAIFSDLSVFWYWCEFWSRVIGWCYFRCNSFIFMFGYKKPRL